MDDPQAFKPHCAPQQVTSFLSSLRYPAPDRVESTTIPSAFHQIFVLTFPKDSLQYIRGRLSYGLHLLQYSLPDSLILRIAGPHVPHIKMMNEAAILKFLATETTIPVPLVLEYSITDTNSLRHEFMIMTCSKGINASTVRGQLSKMQIRSLLDQLTEFLVQLYSHPFHHVGGLRNTEDGAIIPGLLCEETMWMAPDIAHCFDPSESFSTLNPTRIDGYSSFAEWIAAYMNCYIHAIEVSSSLNSWIDIKAIQRLRSFVDHILSPTNAQRYNEIDSILAHRDLHFGQMLVETSESGKDQVVITAILDWEFAQIVPFPLWRRSFLWNANYEEPREESAREKAQLNNMWDQRTKNHKIGSAMLRAEKWRHREQELMWNVCNYLRCVVEVCPRRKQLEDARLWWQEVCKALDQLGITDRGIS